MDNHSNSKPGDFSGLAKDYSESRPDYSKSVIRSILALIDKKVSDIDFVDVGSGTGIWTRMISELGPKSIISIEPNDDMRDAGIKDSKNTKIIWKKASGESTGLEENSADLLTMASSFHWTDFEKSTIEFNRVLRKGGRFVAIWNPRLIEVNPLLLEIENHLKTLNPNIKRVSSGRSGMTNTLTERLWSSEYFDDVIYIEGRHIINMTTERYITAWRSVNDLRVQLGECGFKTFLDYVEERISNIDQIPATYLTRAWCAKNVK